MLILQQLDLIYCVITSDVSNAGSCRAPLKRRSPLYGEKSWIFSSNWFLFNWRKKDMVYSGSEPILYVCRRDSGAASVRLVGSCGSKHANNRTKCEDSLRVLPVEGPLEQELACSFGEGGFVLVRLQYLSDHVVQPSGPLLQGALLLKGGLEIQLEALNYALFTLAHPRGLLLHVINNTSEHQHNAS